MEVDIAGEIDTAAGPDIVDYFDTVEDIVVVDCHNSIGSSQCFVHIRNYWCFGADNLLRHHHGLVHLLDL